MQILKLVFAFVFIWMAACARGPISKEVDPKILYEHACGAKAPGQTVRSAKGTVWVKAKSKEASGQFPAVVEVMPSGDFRMEVTNLFGGTEAIIRVEGSRYQIDIPKQKSHPKEQGSYSWGGIPLHWAAKLFQGKMPCPPLVAVPEMAMSLGSEGELLLETQSSLNREAEAFSFRFRKTFGRLWPESLHWERKGISPLMVDFLFDDPEDDTWSPKKWEAKSALGEVKVRWREREWKK